jgi:hypothetical protein
MLAYIVLLVAVLSRILPHAFHAVSWNFTALGGGLLFFGSRMGSSKRAAWMLPSAVAVLMATDYYLTVFAYGYSFQVRTYLVTWLWYAAVCLLGMGILQRPTLLRLAAGVLASSTSFFLLSNFVVWLDGSMSMYPHSLAGLGACYIAALPFYCNDLASTALTASALFGLPVLAARIVESLQAARHNDLPAA